MPMDRRLHAHTQPRALILRLIEGDAAAAAALTRSAALAPY